MNNKKLKSRYNQIFKEGSRQFFSFNNYNESKIIMDFVDSWENKNVLEIGCGEGNLAAMICMAGALKVDAIDYSEEAVKIARNRYNIDNLNFACASTEDVKDMYDIIILQGVLEHIDKPFHLLKHLMEANVFEDGVIITSSPSFLNPRGYVWMTLQLLFQVPMSLTDIHFLCPFDFELFAEKNNYSIEIKSTDYDWAAGDRTIVDFEKRLPNALSDSGMNTNKVNNFLEWLAKAVFYFEHNDYSGTNVAYKLKKSLESKKTI